jgi:uncharacterized protein
MNREDALDLVRKNIKNENLIKHMLATEVCMKRLAKEFDENETEWALAGLLHDIDYEIIADDTSKHGIVGTEMLEKEGLSSEIIHAIKAHVGKIPRESNMDKALYAVDPLTGLIVASALMHPDKKIKSLDINFVLNRYKEKRFAKGADRDQIKSCEEMKLNLEDFISICIEAMGSISDQLNL